jgi:hypothetical protein
MGCRKRLEITFYGNIGGKQHAPKQRADQGNKSRDTPFSTPFYLSIFENALKK